MVLLAFSLEDSALPGDVAGVFTMERAIKLGMVFLAFLTMFLFSFKLKALFLPLGVAVLV